ncbi:MAG: hypothetical protein JNL80_04260 [Phycisphaerae bacterium]|nr:hypothetical protein [Phycisphaerae bacterium]
MTLGHAIGANLPLVMETEDARSAQVLVDEVREIPGVLHVDVAFIEIDPDDAASQPGSAFGRRRAGERPASDFPSAATCTFP